jgi:two-component sensor histidine kinase
LYSIWRNADELSSFFDTYKAIVDKYKNGESRKGLRWLTNIDDKESAKLVQVFLQSGMQTRHIKNMLPLNFGVSDKEVAFSIEKMEAGKMSSSFLISNEALYVNHFNSLFEELWGNGIDATSRIREIEGKVEVEFVDVIADHEKASSILLDLAKSVKKEALSLMPTARGMLRMYKLGVIEQLIKASQSGTTVKIICPINEVNSHVVQKISEKAPHIKFMNMYADAPSGILIVDGCKFQAEVKNPMAEQFSEAIGFAIYSNSKYNVNSFKSFFDLLWNQHALNEELRRMDKVQKEFINSAAHELRTPVQPILGLSDVLLSKDGDIVQYRELLDAIKRNAKRLQRLTEDILDVTRIEGQSLYLKEEQFNLNDIIPNVINNTLASANALLKNETNTSPIKIDYYEPPDIIIVRADKGRIIQVIDNLLSNATKFTKEGTIFILLQSKKEEDDDKQYVVISVKDTGQGIDPEILPKLFTKFATKSESGTGLGLFISKSIVEAHGGRIWGQNNTDGKGATFAFSLPIVIK